MYSLSHKTFQINYPNKKSIFRGKFNPKSIASTKETDSNSENPFDRFERIKKEIDTIEKDIEFYKNNKELFTKKFNYSFENTYDELSKLKKVTDYIGNTENYHIIKEVVKSNKKLIEQDKNFISLLNKQHIDETNKKLINDINLIKAVKNTDLTDFENICYELYLTPDTNQIKLYSQIVDIQKMVDELKDRIGNYDLVRKL